MYTPPFNAVHDDAEIRAMVAAANVAWLVTADDDGTPTATSLPIMWRGDTVIAHMAKANPQWRRIRPGMPALLIVGGPDAYVSPSWYASKSEHGRVVPTWNYTAVHLAGTVQVHEDPEWLRTAVTELTDVYEDRRTDRWHVDDAPAEYISGQLRGIVGIEVTVTDVQAKAKLSQNRSAADRSGVIAGLRSDDTGAGVAIADAMSALGEG